MDSFSMGRLGQINTWTMYKKKETFCVAPWYNIFVEADKTIKPCCISKSSHYKFDEIEKYFTSPELNEVRDALANGIKHPACDKCWQTEAIHKESLRLISNREFISQKINGKSNIREQIRDPKLSEVNTFDLTLGNLCNLKCVMCSPLRSSQLLAEANQSPDLWNLYVKKRDQKDFNWAKESTFADWCKKYLKHATKVVFSGGEPFLIPWVRDVIEHMPDDQKKNCKLYFTTNLTIIDEKIIKNFSKFKKVLLSVSVEGVEETHEYLRYGHSWKTLVQNIKKIQNYNIDNLVLKVNHVLQAPSYHSVLKMTKIFDTLDIIINPILLTDPAYFQISALPTLVKTNFLEESKNYQGLNMAFVQAVRQHTQNNLHHEPILTEKCIEHLGRLDAVRGNSFKTVIPAQNLSLL